MSYRILIVDDEPLARERLRRLIAANTDWTVVGEVAHGEAALQWLDEQQADLMLLDIQMPGLSGLEVAREVQTRAAPPQIIFCTAHDGRALDAFRVQALDYLLKPVRPEDLSRALERAKQWLNQTSHTSNERKYLRSSGHRGVELIALDHIIACIAEQKYVTVLHDGGETLIDESLKQLEEAFPHRFIRAHRNALVAIARIQGLEPISGGGHRLRLLGLEQPIVVSRRQFKELKKVMSEL